MISEHYRLPTDFPSERLEAEFSEAAEAPFRRSVFRVLVRRGWVALVLSAVVLGGAFWYVSRTRPLYTASSRVYVQQTGLRVMREQPNTGRSTSTYLNTQCELIRSVPIVAMAEGTCDINRMATFAGVHSPVMAMHDSLFVTAGNTDDIITVSFEGPSPDEAAQLVNAVVASYISYSSTQNPSVPGEVLGILRKEKNNRETEMSTKVKAIDAFRHQTGSQVVDSSRGAIVAQGLHPLIDAHTAAKLALVDIGARLGPNHPSYTVALRREQELKAAVVEKEKEIADFDARAADYTRLQAELQRTARAIDLIDSRIKEVNVGDNVGTLNITVLEPAIAPDSPSHPHVFRTMLSAAIGGLAFGLLAAFWLDWRDDRLRNVEEAASLRLPVLTVVPRMGRKMKLALCGRAARLEPDGEIAEAFRALRVAIEFGPPSKTILVTSPTRGDGKSTVASNLAITLAASGHRTVLVDANLRSPAQRRIWGLKSMAGLATMLDHGLPFEEAKASTNVRNLDLLPAGRSASNPSELVDSERFSSMLLELRARYDYVVVDSPQVLSVTDSRLLGAMCDVTLLVVRAKKTNRRHAIHARNGLLAFGAGLLGIVVNSGRRHAENFNFYGNSDSRPELSLRREPPRVLTGTSRVRQLPLGSASDAVQVKDITVRVRSKS